MEEYHDWNWNIENFHLEVRTEKRMPNITNSNQHFIEVLSRATMQEKENLYKDLKGGNGKTLFKSTIMLTD